MERPPPDAQCPLRGLGRISSAHLLGVCDSTGPPHPPLSTEKPTGVAGTLEISAAHGRGVIYVCRLAGEFSTARLPSASIVGSAVPGVLLPTLSPSLSPPGVSQRH